MASFLLARNRKCVGNKEVLKIIDLTLEIEKDASHSCLAPSLNEITVYSTDHDGSSDSSISSMTSIGSNEIDDSFESERRTLFPSYWERGLCAHSRHCGFPPLISTAPFCVEEKRFGTASDSNKEEQYTSSYKRRIFRSFVSESTPALSIVSLQIEGLRKAHSTSALRRKPSCLRQSRFSSAGRPRSKSCSDSPPSVSFSTKVDIKVFDNPKEFWSPKGWNEYFAI
jgi:hypothetical protein